MVSRDLFRAKPLEVVDGIPIFAVRDSEYIENYDRISADHLRSVDHGHGNPFMDEEVWQDLEANTVRLIKQHVPDGAAILDVGVGTGRLLGNFPNLICHGVDVSVDYLKRLKNTHINVAMANIDELPYHDACFDAVVSTDVLEHVLDLYGGVCEMLRVLKPGGILVVRVPYREDLAPYTADDYPYALAHVRSFDEHELYLLFGKILKMSKLDQDFDKCLSSERLLWPVALGRRPLSWLIRWVSRVSKRMKSFAFFLYKPTEITVVYRKQ